MKNTNLSNNSRLRLLGVAIIALAGTIAPQCLHAGTTWDGGGGSDTTVTNDLNWGGAVNALNGTQPAIFATGGSNATLNVNAKFKTLTFNQADGFVVNGPGTLTVSNSTSSTTINFSVSALQNNGATVINTPMFVDTGASGTRLLVLDNNGSPGAAGGPSLIISNKLVATVPANTWAFRLRGTGLTKFVGAISNCAAVQPAFGATVSGTNIFAGNQALGSTTDVGIQSPSTSSSVATTRIQMGESTSDIQTWRATVVQQIGTVAINSTATLLGGVGIENNNTAGTHGGILEVNGSLTATTLGIGSGSFTGTMKLAGPAYFSGTVSVGATPGSLILGNAATLSALTLSSGTISSGVTIGGGDANNNNITLIKTNSGTLTLGGTHTYIGPTLVQAGRLDLSGTITSSVTVSNSSTLGGEGSTTGTITFGPGTETLAFDPSTAEALTADSVDARGATVVISPISFADGLVLQTPANPILGSIGANFIIGSRSGSLGFNPAGNQLYFTNGAAAAASLKWTGNSANPTFWDVVTTPNWSNKGNTDRFYNGDHVTFDDSAVSTVVAVQGAVTAGSIIFSNTAKAYTISGGGIGGAGSLVKYGTNLVTLTNSGPNTFTGGITNHSGRLVFNSLSQLGTYTNVPLVLDGGSLGYAGSVNGLDNGFQMDIHSSGVDVGVLSSNVYLGRGKVTGPGNWTKSGSGWLLLGVNGDTSLGNDFTGKLTITAGLVDIRHGDSLGSPDGITEVQNASLLIQNFSQTSGSTITVPEPLLFTGTSFLEAYNQEAKTFTDILSGPITNASGSTVGISTAQSVATAVISLELSGGIETGTGSTLAFGRRGTYTAGILNVPQSVTVSGVITGPGAVLTESTTNASLFTLSAANTYTGETTLNGGTLSLGYSGSIATTPVITVNSNAILDVSGVAFTLGVGQKLAGNGTVNGNVAADSVIRPGAPVGTLTFNNDLTINGNLVFDLNKSLAQSNGAIHVVGTLANTSVGTLTVSNLGPGLVAGDKFTLFNQPLPNGLSLTIIPPAGVTFTNQLADDGSLTVLTAPPLVNTNPTNITTSLSGNILTLSWPADYLGWRLLTNSVSATDTNAWFTYPGSATATNVVIPINPAKPHVFFRMIYP
jgi:autotransporter-associated beta strand protein